MSKSTEDDVIFIETPHECEYKEKAKKYDEFDEWRKNCYEEAVHRSKNYQKLKKLEELVMEIDFDYIITDLKNSESTVLGDTRYHFEQIEKIKILENLKRNKN